MTSWLDRRGFLLGATALVTHCAHRPAPVAPQLEVVDALPAFFAFWEHAHAKPLDAQVAAFRDQVVMAYPSVYRANVLGLPDADADAALDARLRTWLPTVPRLIAGMRDLRARFTSDVDAAVGRFRAALPDFGWRGRVYLFASVDSMNGAVREVDGETAVVFGADVIARDTGSMPLPVLFAHELFHVYHAQVLAPDPEARHVYDALWGEGLATYASQLLTPGASDDHVLPMSHRHDPANPALDHAERRVQLAQVMPGLAPTLGAGLRGVLDSEANADYATYFLGRAHPNLGEQPVRSGYWFGLQLARALGRRQDLATLARRPVRDLRADLETELTRLIEH